MDGERVFDATPEELDLEDNDQIDVFRGNPWNYSSDSSSDDQSDEISEENDDDEDIQKEEATANASGSEAAASENGKGIVLASEVTSHFERRAGFRNLGQDDYFCRDVG